MRPVMGSVGVVYAVAGWRSHFDQYAIQIGTQSRYSHTALVSQVKGDQVWIIEADPKGVRQRVLHPQELPYWRFEADPAISTGQRTRMVMEAETLVGTPYDWWDIVKFLVRFFIGRVTTVRKDYADDKIICSELVSWCLHVGGIDPWPGTAYGAVSPGDVAEWMFAANHTFG